MKSSWREEARLYRRFAGLITPHIRRFCVSMGLSVVEVLVGLAGTAGAPLQ